MVLNIRIIFFEGFCLEHNIKHIFSSLYHPQTNGVIETTHKEIRKNIIIFYSVNNENLNLKNVIINAIEN